MAWRETALALNPSHVAYREGVAGEINNLARTLQALGRADEAQAMAAAALADLQAFLAATPGDREALQLQAQARAWAAGQT